MQSKVTELRCPEDPRRLFSKLLRSGEGLTVVGANLIEFSCQNCRKAMRQSGVDADRVLHRYNLLGELVETETLVVQ